MVDLKSDGKIKLTTYSNSYKWRVMSCSAVNDGNWHHLAFVQIDNGGQMYLNSILDQTENTSGRETLLSTIKTYLGGDLRDNRSYYSGKVDDLKIYNRALSVSKIQTLFYTSD